MRTRLTTTEVRALLVRYFVEPIESATVDKLHRALAELTPQRRAGVAQSLLSNFMRHQGELWQEHFPTRVEHAGHVGGREISVWIAASSMGYPRQSPKLWLTRRTATSRAAASAL